MKKVVITFLLLVGIFSTTFSQNVQVGNGEVLLQGNYVEVGISPCGSFGNTTIFPNSHFRTDNGLGIGFVADPDKDGWNVGGPVYNGISYGYYGDYFVPGDPVEGWGIQIFQNDSSNLYVNGSASSICEVDNGEFGISFGISGSNVDTLVSGNKVSSTWKSDANFTGGVSVCQTTFLNATDAFFTVSVKLCNTSGRKIDSLFYMRAVDADNDRMITPLDSFILPPSPLSSSRSTYITDNRIESSTIVSARGIYQPNAFLALGTSSPNARVAIDTYDIFLPDPVFNLYFFYYVLEFLYYDPTSIQDIWNATNDYSRTPGLVQGINRLVQDVNIALAYKFVNIQPGQCVNFTFTYAMNLADLQKAINSTSNNFTITANGKNITHSLNANVVKDSTLSISLVGNTAFNWTWTPSDGSATLTGSNQTLTPDHNLTYNLVGISSDGCNQDTLRYTIKVNTADPYNCSECVSTFSPQPEQKYLLSAWVREDYTNTPPPTYINSGIQITFNDSLIVLPIMRASGPIIEGWQRIEQSFVVPTTANNIQVHLVNDTVSNAYFDDIRIHPFRSNMKSYVYDPSTQRLTAELDENNYATRYEYDDEGILIRVKKETERGIMTIKETRNNQSKINTR